MGRSRPHTGISSRTEGPLAEKRPALHLSQEVVSVETLALADKHTKLSRTLDDVEAYHEPLAVSSQPESMPVNISSADHPRIKASKNPTPVQFRL